MPQATSFSGLDQITLTAASAVAVGDLYQLPDGRAGVFAGASAKAQGSSVGFTPTGQYRLAKATTYAFLDGGRVYWNRSAGQAHYKRTGTRDFYVGRVVGDKSQSDDTVIVDLNAQGRDVVDMLRDPCLTVPIGTQVLGGFLPPQLVGGSLSFKLTATSEAQKVDLITVDGFATGANAIVEVAFRIPTGGSAAAVDYSIGIANDTHATDADLITDSLFIHIDGGSTALNLESDDGTTEVAATDTTTDYVAGTSIAEREEWWFDMRNPADVQVYRNGVLMLPSTVFNVNASVATWKLLVHLEKTTGTATADLLIDWFRARTAEQ